MDVSAEFAGRLRENYKYFCIDDDFNVDMSPKGVTSSQSWLTLRITKEKK